MLVVEKLEELRVGSFIYKGSRVWVITNANVVVSQLFICVLRSCSVTQRWVTLSRDVLY